MTKLVAYSCLSYKCTQDAGGADGSHRVLTCGECLFGVGAHFQAFQPHLEIALKSLRKIFLYSWDTDHGLRPSSFSRIAILLENNPLPSICKNIQHSWSTGLDWIQTVVLPQNVERVFLREPYLHLHLHCRICQISRLKCRALTAASSVFRPLFLLLFWAAACFIL